MKKILIKTLKILLCLLLALLLFVAGGLGVLTILEYRPAEVEELAPETVCDRSDTPAAGDKLKLVTWNIGYGALGDNADFFMDGGSMVYTADRTRLAQNLEHIRDTLEELSPDVLFVQEIDRDSDRSYHTEEVRYLSGDRADPTGMTGMSFVFANNFRASFVPYPIPPIGRVNSGILTGTAWPVASAQRIQLPCPFSWPVRIANLKRCLLVTRIPVTDSDKELVLVNLHLEAFDDGEGKIAQTAQLAELLKKERDAGNYVIAGGDFNQTFSNIDNSAYPELPGKWHSGWIDVSALGDGFTCVMDPRTPSGRSLDQSLTGAAEKDPAHFQYYVLDGFIVTDNISVESCDVIDLGFKYSDHNPLQVSVTLH